MIPTLPVSHQINAGNLAQVPGIQALEYKKPQPMLDHSGPRLFHSNLGVVQDGFMDYCRELMPYLNDNKMVHFSFDLGPAAENVETVDYYYEARSPILDDDALSKLISQRLQWIKQAFTGRVLLENLNYFPTTAYHRVCDAGFIRETVVENGVGLLLDIGHAMISAYNFGLKPWDYFRQLPLEHVWEIHLTAPGRIAGTWRDLHEIPTETEYQLLEGVLERLSEPPYVAVEYYRNFNKIIESYGNFVDRYHNVIKNTQV